MSTTAANLAIPYYSHRLNSEKEISFVHPTKTDGAVISFLSSTKGVADSFGLISKSTKLFEMAYPESIHWTSHASAVTSQARTSLAIPSVLCLIGRCAESFKNSSYGGATRNSLELCSSGSLAASLLVTDKSLSATLANIGSVFKTFVDAIDLGSAVGKFFEYARIRSEIVSHENVPEELREGISSQITVTVLKVGRFALALFAGVLSVLLFVFKVTISKDVLLAGAIASVVSLIFSVTAELTAESARIIPASPELIRLGSKQVVQQVVEAVA